MTKTGLKGLVDFRLEFSPNALELQEHARPSLFSGAPGAHPGLRREAIHQPLTVLEKCPDGPGRLSPGSEIHHGEPLKLDSFRAAAMGVASFFFIFLLTFRRQQSYKGGTIALAP